MKIKRIRVKKNGAVREVVADRKRRVIYKSGPLNTTDMKRMKLLVKGSERCDCPTLDNAMTKLIRNRQKKGKKNKAFYLAMGRKVGKKLLVTVLHSWPKKNKILKLASRDNFGDRDCPAFGSLGSS